MIHRNPAAAPSLALQAGFTFAGYRPGDERAWAEIETGAGEFECTERALEQFRREFGGYKRELNERCIFILNESGLAVGTAMAWFNDSFQGERFGRLHWVGIIPAYQGLKLGKPLVSRAMAVLSARHDRVYLTTQTESIRAIKIYLDFGFRPLIADDAHLEAWKQLARALPHPALRDFRAG
jgi:ribosomal protein S18 acetylase RimI-like enzyme